MIAGLFCATAAAAAPQAAAQSLWLPRDSGAWFRLEGYRPALDGTHLTGLSSAWFATGQWRFNEDVWAVVEVPFAFGEREGNFAGDATDLDPGNPYLGGRWRGDDGSFVDVGGRLPLGRGGPGAQVGILSDPARPGAFGPDVGTVHVRAGRGSQVADRAVLEPSTGFTWLLGDGGTALYALYGAVLRGSPGPLFWSAGATGRYAVGGADLGASTFHHAGGALGHDFGPFSAAFTLQVPLFEEFAVDWIAGLALQAALR